MSRYFSGLNFFSITTIAVVSSLFPLQAIANEISFDSLNKGINGDVGQYYLANFNLDLEEFCRDYPYNSRCELEGMDEPELKPEEIEPTSDEETEVRDNSWAVVANASTLGFGGSIVAKIQPQLNGRVGVNAFGFGLDYEETRGSYDADVNLFNVATAIDYYPFKKSGFYTSLGVVYTDNNADGVAQASSIFDVEVAGLDITADELLDVNADIKTSNNFAPYLGIGWGNPISGKLGFWANLGVMFPGSPEAELSPNYKVDRNLLSAEVQQEIQDSLEEEEEAIKEDLDRFNVYPIISIGLSYSF